MAHLLEFSSRSEDGPHTVSVKLEKVGKLVVKVSLWSYVDIEGETLSKAALLKVKFLDSSGQDISSDARQLFQGKDFHFKYLTYQNAIPQEISFESPKNAETVEFEFAPWQLKQLKAKLISVIYEENGNQAQSDSMGALPYEILKSYKTINETELQNRIVTENLILESMRQKRDYSENTPLPDLDEMEHSSDYSLGKAFAERRPENGEKKRMLLICGGYPSEEERYVNAFLHSRIKAYQEQGIHVDVLTYARGMKEFVRQFDGVNILQGYVAQMAAVLTFGKYDAVAVHFMHPHMWPVMRNFLSRHKFHIFIHGHDIRSWSRGFDYVEGLDVARRAIMRFYLIKDLWHAMVAEKQGPVSYTFVSKWMLDAAEEDLGLRFPRELVNVVHNGIDTEFYEFKKKDPALRKKILMIRNFDKHVYATDIALKTLQTLKTRDIWPELEISIYGRGVNFKQFQQEFADDANVILKEGYLNKYEIKAAHAVHGLMLIPSRLDSQGVSRDEAMSSGLVPVTNNVCAIPEFADASCAILAQDEDFLTLAQGIEEIAKSPERFLEMSKAASQSVLNQRSAAEMITKELKLMQLI